MRARALLVRAIISSSRGFALRNPHRHFSAQQQLLSSSMSVPRAFSVMQLPPDTVDNTIIKSRYRELARKYHPDTGGSESQFLELTAAYEVCLNYLITNAVSRATSQSSSWSQSQSQSQPRKSQTFSQSPFAAEWESVGYEHTIPQHRRHLNFEGVGFGSMEERQRQYNIFKLERAFDRVSDYRAEKMTKKFEREFQQRNAQNNGFVNEEEKEAHDISLQQLYHQRRAKKGGTIGAPKKVEEMLEAALKDWSSEAQSLSAFGRPFTNDELMMGASNVGDILTNRMNRIMKNNGFVPEWIELEQTIRERYCEACRELERQWNQDNEAHDNFRMTVGSDSGSDSDLSLAEDVKHFKPATLTHPSHMFGQRWEKHVGKFVDEIKSINTNVIRFNFIVPIAAKQRVLYLPTNVIEYIQRRAPALVVVKSPIMQGNYSVGPHGKAMSGAVLVSVAAPIALVAIITGTVISLARQTHDESKAMQDSAENR